MAVSLSQCGVRVTFISTATRARLRRGDFCVAMVATCQGCRELSLKVVDCSGLQRREKGKQQGARFLSGRESAPWCSKQQLKRCAVVCCCFLTHHNIYMEEAPLKDAYSVSYLSRPNHILCLPASTTRATSFEKVARLFNPGDFDASKLTVRFEDNANDIKAKSVEDLLPRKYTLTHSDVTGELLLSIGPSFNRQQLTDWYTRLMRDEIVAEWRGSEQISLHVHCHVSGGHVLLAPAALRNSIFEREMPLVLEAIRHGDEDLLAEHPELHASTVWVHFHSSDPAYNRADCWGPLFYAASPIRRVTGKLVPSCISEPFTPLTVVKVQKDPAELCSVMSP